MGHQKDGYDGENNFMQANHCDQEHP
jgi:hypothetical protein